MKEALLKLKDNTKTKVDFDVIVYNYKIDNDLDFIEIDVVENNILYEKLTLIKGEIYPLPKPKDILNIKEIYLDYDDNLYLRLFIKGEIKSQNLNSISINDNILFSFSYNKINESLKIICEIKEDLFSSIFRIDSFNDKYYSLFCLKENALYNILNKNFSTFVKDEFVLISNYIKNKNEIEKTNLTIIKKLKEEKLLQFFYAKSIFGEKLTLLKIVDINEKYYIAINNNKELYQIDKSQKLRKLGVKICQILIVQKFKILYNMNNFFKEIILGDDSIIYISQQEIFFSTLTIPINFLTIVHIVFLDYEINNLYDAIIIDGTKYIIDSKEIYCVLNFDKNKFDFYPIEIVLESSKLSNESKIFFFFLYKGLINKINAFVNYNSGKAYCIEYFYMNIDNPLNIDPQKTYIKIKNIEYKLKYFDTFNSENRQRINVLNVPYQKIENFEEKILNDNNINSFQICNIIYKKKTIVFGIFDIKEALSIRGKEDNSYYDEFYEDFGDIPSLMQLENREYSKLKNICLTKYTKSSIDKSIKTITNVYNAKLTYSQYKTRLGLLLCYYINKCSRLYDFSNLISRFDYIQGSFESTNITYLQRLRIFILYLRKKLADESSLGHIIFFSKLSENSPYKLARELNKNEIMNLTEFSRYFPAYLQIDSYIMFNYYKKERSYSFSLEMLFIMKHYLLSNYEDFFFITREESNEFAYQAENENITVINERNIFINNLKSIKDVDNIDESKNVALPITFEFRQEKNGHQKRNNKNSKVLSPFLFYKDGKIERIQEEAKYDNKNILKGENRQIIESYLSMDKSIILQLKIIPIFGELLDYNFFIEKDFSRLLNKMKEIKSKKKITSMDEQNSKCEIFDKIVKSTEKNIEELSKAYAEKLEKEGIIAAGDVHYDKEEFIRIVNNMNNMLKKIK